MTSMEDMEKTMLKLKKENEANLLQIVELKQAIREKDQYIAYLQGEVATKESLKEVEAKVEEFRQVYTCNHELELDHLKFFMSHVNHALGKIQSLVEKEDGNTKKRKANEDGSSSLWD